MLFGIMSCPLWGNAQSSCYTLTDQPFFVIPDSIAIIPSSIVVKNGDDVQVSFKLNQSQDSIKLIGEAKEPHTFCFDYLKKQHTITSSKYKVAAYDSSALFTYQPASDTKSKENTLFSDLDVSGAFSRGLSVGNRQSVFMNSAMNLSLSGPISDELMLKATITDQQIPYEPEGNTQRLQDFDRVNIQLLHKNWSLEAGDIWIKENSANSFLRYNRQVQGIGVTTNVLGDSTSETSVLTSFSKSKFATQIIEPIEGVLGPYRITGPQNEPFIFLIANSEKVYMDGVLLARGVSQDYVIDYNAAEITFNAKHFISKYTRIQIEFEYSDQQYARNITALRHKQKVGNVTIQTGYYQESDNPNQSIHEFSFDDKEFLANYTREDGSASIPAIDSVGYTDEQIRYEKRDTLLAGVFHTVYKYSRNPEKALYRVNFSMVGEENGNYIKVYDPTNGEIYEWIAPVNGNPQGNYAPIKRVVLPKQNKVFALSADYSLSNNDEVSVHLASSNYTENRYNAVATKEKGKAAGLHYKSSEKNIGEVLSTNYHFSYSYVDSMFTPVQNFQSVSFNRNWGVNNTNQYMKGEEHLFQYGASMKNQANQLSYSGALRDKEGFGKGYQQEASFRHSGNITIDADYFKMQNTNDDVNSDWNRWNTEVMFNPFYIKPGYRLQSERHLVSNGDSAISTLNNFVQHQFFIQNSDSLDFQFRLSHSLREDFRPIEGVLTSFERSQISQMNSIYQYGSNQLLSVDITRKEIVNLQSDSLNSIFYQGGVQWTNTLFNNFIHQDLQYQLGTGRVLDRNYYFQEVSRNLGTHSWADLNGNGVKELEEFFEDNTEYGDRNYVKILTLSNEYTMAFTNLLRYAMRFYMPHNWRKKGGILGLVSRFSGSLHMSSESKNTFSDWGKRLNPFEQSDEVLQNRYYLKTALHYNRGGKVEAYTRFNQSENKQLVFDGFEGRIKDGYAGGLNWRITEAISLGTAYYFAENSTFSQVLEERNYAYISNKWQPEIAWQPGNKWRITSSYSIDNKQTVSQEGVLGGVSVGELAIQNKLIQAENRVIVAKIGLVEVISDLDDNNSPLAYELFEGLQPGQNVIWNLNLQQKVIGDLHLNVNYSGRKTQQGVFRHNGSLQLTALF